MSYDSRSRELDREILRAIEGWHRDGRDLAPAEFDALALRLFAYQREYNEPYARYCASLEDAGHPPPRTWFEIPAVPSEAFKEARLCTFESAQAALSFETSGTTTGRGGRHYLQTRELYDAALLAGFDRFVLTDGARLRYLQLVPDPRERPQSSLGYMMARVAELRGDGETGWYLRGDELFFEAFARDLDRAIEQNVPVCIAATAFALVRVLEICAGRRRRFALPRGSRIMETGGFKGRTRTVERRELYDDLERRFGVERRAIVAEYGMTELTSQYYDTPASRESDARVKSAPPWLRAWIAGPDGRPLPPGTIGALVHVDLANRSSCVAVQTEDLAVATHDGFILLGRESGARLRGCSLDAESLRAAARA